MLPLVCLTRQIVKNEVDIVLKKGKIKNIHFMRLYVHIDNVREFYMKKKSYEIFIGCSLYLLPI